ncbi:hypothetical protein GLAREA_01253 [Glarea lozoyensis ATCC 20868]|uniref:Chitin synthesis regulation, Congo red resistance, RCR protein n=1 Tax=Glarea lozoyensis (strain ATCC 20868 / MF5171) TaxID=1116229 RepID=S3CZV4_GLAL2|nr:uncharacterized protein GLAREA_01253 [Glarea lozoyensis ATCC 20868]EPE25341.1 hypothetical protein GLAREA_01253 [Glarea lozoyensis ATCC 20868]
MAPAVMQMIAKRYYCSSYSYYGDDCTYSAWNDWGRWVALAVIVVAVLVFAFLVSCINTRRRRRRGLAPMYGTGWMPGNKNPPQGNQQYGGYYGAPAPPYTPAPMPNQQTGTTFQSGDGYYGANNNAYGANGNGNGNGFEMQPPQNAYQPQRGGEPVYEAPLGPPPTKGGAIIR